MESFKIRAMTAVWAYVATVATVNADDTVILDAALDLNI